ncbi:hypothetical protein [Streptomyces sp. NPDC055186]
MGEVAYAHAAPGPAALEKDGWRVVARVVMGRRPFGAWLNVDRGDAGTRVHAPGRTHRPEVVSTSAATVLLPLIRALK